MRTIRADGADTRVVGRSEEGGGLMFETPAQIRVRIFGGHEGYYQIHNLFGIGELFKILLIVSWINV